jgi:UPF0271 protein
MQIDLNADLGEGAGSDEALLGLVSSANIACGWHAGDAKTMRQCVRWAMEHGVAIGAHPSFPDRENFGRSTMHLPPDEIVANVLYQVGALAAIVKAEGGKLSHVKAHGQLYNQAVKEPELADALCEAVRRFDPSLKFFGLAGSGMIDAARRAGLTPVEEVFADRGYMPDGSLVPRSQPGALIERRRAVAGPDALAGARPPGDGHRRQHRGRSMLRPCACMATVPTRWPLRAAFATGCRPKASRSGPD